MSKEALNGFLQAIQRALTPTRSITLGSTEQQTNLLDPIEHLIESSKPLLLKAVDKPSNLHLVVWEWAVAYGNQAVLNHLLTNSTDFGTGDMLCRAVAVSAWNGNLTMVDYFLAPHVSYLNLPKHNPPMWCTRHSCLVPLQYDALQACAVKGHLAILKHLCQAFALKEDAVMEVAALAAFHGQLQILQHLLDTFKVAPIVNTSRHNPVLKGCQCGHLEVVKHLCKRWSLVKSKQIQLALLMAAQNGHLAVVQYLVSHFQITQQEVQQIQCQLYRVTAEHGHVLVMNFFIATYGFTNLEASCFLAFDTLCHVGKNGHLLMLELLVNNWVPDPIIEHLQAFNKAASLLSERVSNLCKPTPV